jgi:hypothetical protein
MCKLSKFQVAEPTLVPGTTVRKSAYELGKTVLLRSTVEISPLRSEPLNERNGLVSSVIVPPSLEFGRDGATIWGLWVMAPPDELDQPGIWD